MATPVLIMAGMQAAAEGFKLAHDLLVHYWTTSNPDAKRVEQAKGYYDDFQKAILAQDVLGANAAHAGLLRLLSEAIAVRIGA